MELSFSPISCHDRNVAFPGELVGFFSLCEWILWTESTEAPRGVLCTPVALYLCPKRFQMKEPRGALFSPRRVLRAHRTLDLGSTWGPRHVDQGLRSFAGPRPFITVQQLQDPRAAALGGVGCFDPPLRSCLCVLLLPTAPRCPHPLCPRFAESSP